MGRRPPPRTEDGIHLGTKPPAGTKRRIPVGLPEAFGQRRVRWELKTLPSNHERRRGRGRGLLWQLILANNSADRCDLLEGLQCCVGVQNDNGAVWRFSRELIAADPSECVIVLTVVQYSGNHVDKLHLAADRQFEGQNLETRIYNAPSSQRQTGLIF